MGAAIPRRKPVQRRSAETVEAILEAAAQVFERHGYAAGTTNRIAARAGVSIGTLYQYFADKDAVLVALTERHLDEGVAVLTPVLRGLLEDPPPVREGLREVVQALVELHRGSPALHRVLFEEAPRPESLRARFEAAFEGASEALCAYLRMRPEVIVGDRRLAADIVTRLLEAITHGLVIHPRAGITPEQYAEESLTLFERYLTGAASTPRAVAREPSGPVRPS